MKSNKDGAFRKRAQIAKTNRVMFMWIAIASVLIGAAAVVSIYMFQKLVYNEKVLIEKQTTLSTIEKNNEVITQLAEEIRVLDTNTDLASVKANESDQAVQVVLDALPADANSLALGASLQNKLLRGIDGLKVESLQVTPVDGVETLAAGGTGEVIDASTSSDGTSAASGEITFQFTVSGSEKALKEVLRNLERSIRAITITGLSIEAKETQLVMTVSGKAYYEPAKTIKLEDKVVQP